MNKIDRDINTAILVAALIAAFAIAMLASIAARAHPMDVPYHDWYVSQLRYPEDSSAPPASSCCGDTNGDAREVDVRSLPNGHYEVFVPETQTWMLYPLAVNPDYVNPTGANIAWYIAYKIGDHWTVNFFCLRLAQGM